MVSAAVRACLTLASAGSAGGMLIRTKEGIVEGIYNKEFAPACTGQFFGIPYAEPPTGERRFASPVAHGEWEGALNATSPYVPTCLQQVDGGVFNFGSQVEGFLDWLAGGNESEDCLFLNVETPSLRPERPLPVLVYIHGGSYLSGSGGPMNASQICERDIVFVSINYRLGVLGSLCTPDMLEEGGTCGNWALQDQRLALEWVQRNIAAFGGDPARVTVEGESAGAMSVAAHLGLPRSEALFGQAVMMSGNDDSMLLEDAYAAGERFAASVGCGGRGGLACLRQKRALSLVDGQTLVFNQSMRALQMPVIDGFELPVGTTLAERFSTGLAKAKPTIAGTNKDDISMFFIATGQEILRGVQAGDIVESVARFFPSASTEEKRQIAALFDPSRFGSDAYQALYQLGTDGYFSCPTRRVAAAMAAGEPRVFRYRFSRVLSTGIAELFGFPASIAKPLDTYLEKQAPFKYLGAYHGANEAVFWNYWNSTAGYTDAEMELGRRMTDMWAAFVSGGDPWTGYGANETFIDLDGDAYAESTRLDAEECAVVGKFPFSWNPMTLNSAPFFASRFALV